MRWSNFFKSTSKDEHAGEKRWRRVRPPVERERRSKHRDGSKLATQPRASSVKARRRAKNRRARRSRQINRRRVKR